MNRFFRIIITIIFVYYCARYGVKFYHWLIAIHYEFLERNQVLIEKNSLEMCIN